MIKEGPLVFIGGTGRLGKEFLESHSGYYGPSHTDLDITNPNQVREYFHDVKPQAVIHAAAVVGKRESEIDQARTFTVNVLGTEAIAKAAQETQTHLIYLSSVSVFDGQKGNYREDDVPIPAYFYGWTKLLGEQSVKMVPDHTIVRTDFFVPGSLKYPQAYTDHYCSKIPVGELVDALSLIQRRKITGILHVGQPRKALFDILLPFQPDLQGIKIADSTLPDFPPDLSLDVSRYQSLLRDN